MAQLATTVVQPTGGPATAESATPAGLCPAMPGIDAARQRASSRYQIRLVISLPVVLILFTLIFGFVSYTTFNRHWDELIKLGAWSVASELLKTHLITMLILTVMAGIMGLALSYSILRPIRALAEATERVARGQLDGYVSSVPAVPELEGLSHSFNAMLEQLNLSITQRNHCLMEGIPVGILTTDLAGCVTAASPIASDLLGLPIERLNGRSLGELAELLPSANAPLLAEMRRILDHSAGGTTHEIELKPIVKGDGSTATQGPRRLLVSGNWLRDAANQPAGVIYTFRDAAPLNLLNDHLRRTDRLAALGTFSLGLAHELRNPLAAIKGLSQLMQLERDLPAGASNYLHHMVGEVERVDSFVSKLLELAEQPGGATAPTALEVVLRQAIALARREIDAQKLAEVKLRAEIDSMPPLMLEAERMAQAFARILQNAWEFSPVGGVITLRAGAAPDPNAGDFEVTIGNSGSAIAPRDMEKIFEPFFTTRDKATGLGLTIANQIIVQNGGTLEARSGPEGVKFIARFGPDRIARESTVKHLGTAVNLKGDTAA